MSAGTRTLKVGYLARVEGEGSMLVKVKDGRVERVEVGIFEPPRFFEGLLRGRAWSEAPDITARICGICPVAYQMSAVHAVEQAFGVRIEAPVRELRRLLYCGEWIESHALHIYMLHAPDFLGYDDAILMSRDHPTEVARGLELKKIGNRVMTAVGGREIHPVNVRVGGFWRVPSRSELAALRPDLERAREMSLETVRWVAGFEFPEFERDYEFVSLQHPVEYPLCEGRIVSSRGLDLPPAQYDAHFAEEHVRHSNSLRSSLRDRGNYMVGPLGRYALNFDRLTPAAKDAAAEAGLDTVCRNPFKGILVRAVETLWACEEALRIVAAYEPPERPSAPVTPRASTGYACSEAPRGMLYHRYRFDDRGTILDAKIVPPTSQNLRTIEDDLSAFVPPRLDLPERELTWQCEQAIRNYDPCISCATHFLKVRIER